jgi:membrane associated rhomboid family serine protease
MQHGASKLRFPTITVLVVLVSVMQLCFGWRWGLYGYSEGSSRLLQSFSSVLAHADTKHLFMNMGGLLLGAGCLEALRGSRWVLAAFLIAGVDGFFFASGYTFVCGASGMVMAGMAACVMFVPTAFGMARDGRKDARARLSYLAAQLGVFVVPIGVMDDVLRIGDASEVNHGAHIRGAIGGLVLGVIGVLHTRVQKRREEALLDTAASDGRNDAVAGARSGLHHSA